MKTLKLFLIAALAVVAVSCAGSRDKEINDKIAAGEQLTPDEWTVVIDYLGHYAEEAQPLQDAIDNESAQTADANGKNAGKLADLTAKYQYLDSFTGALTAATEAEIGADNVRAVNKYSQYPAFPAPAWATVNTNPNVEGMIEQMPSDSSKVADTVVAQGDGEMVK